MNSKKKAFLIIKRIAAVILSVMMVASVVPMGYAETSAVISQWQDGFNYVEENSRIEADIPENTVVVVKGSSITVDKEINLSGVIWFADEISSVNLTGDGTINVSYPGAYIKQKYAVFGYGNIDLTGDTDAESIWGENVGSIKPVIDLSGDAELVLSGNYSDNAAGSKITFSKGTATVKNNFRLGANDVLEIGASANILKDESASLITAATSKIYNKSAENGVLSILKDANCKIYHYVTNISDSTKSGYIESGKDYVVSADKNNGYKLSSVKVNGAPIQITDEYSMGVKTNEPYSIETVVSEVTPSSLTISSDSSEFLPGGTYSFNVSVIPENTRNKKVIWSVTDSNNHPIDKSVASIDQNGNLSIGRDVPDGYEIKICVKSEADPSIVAFRSITANVSKGENINDYLLFNGEQYTDGKWYSDSVTVSISQSAKSAYTKLAYTTENGELRYSDDLSDSVTLVATTKNVKFKLFKEDAGALDISGSYNILIDNTAPVIESVEVIGTNPSQGTNWWKNEQQFKIVFSDSESGVSAFEYKVKNSDTAITGGTITKNEETGKYEAVIAIGTDTSKTQEYIVKAYDGVGKESVEKSFNVYVDNNKPSLKAYIDTQDPTLNFIEIITLGLVKINKTHSIKIEADDENGSGIREIGYKLVEAGQNEDEVDWTVREGNAKGIANIDNIKLASEGVYTVLAYAEDMVGNKEIFTANTEDDNLGTVMIDKTNPIITLRNGNGENITASNEATYVNIDNNDFVLKATAKDNEDAKAVSGLKDFTASFSYGGQTIGEYIFDDYKNSFGEEFSFDSATLIGFLNKGETQYSALPDGEYAISFRAEDEAGNKSDVVTHRVIVETVEPTINVNYAVEDGKFATEKELVIDVATGCTGIKSLSVSYGSGKDAKTEVLSGENGKYTYIAKENAEYKFVALSNAGNKSETSFNVDLIDTATPTISISAYQNGNFSTAYKSGTWVKTDVNVFASNSTQNKGTDKYFYRVKPEDDVDTPWAEIIKDGDGKYKVDFSDDCNTQYEFKLVSENGKESIAEINVKIDKTAPVIKGITFEDVKILFFFTKNTNVTIAAEDISKNNVESGVSKVEYKVYSSKNNEMIENKTKTVDKDGKITFDLPKNFNGYVEARAYDKAGNVTAEWKSSDKVVVDNTAPVIELSYDDSDRGYVTTDGVEYYPSAKKVTVKVKEANFNADDVIFTVASDYDSNAVEIDSSLTPANDKGVGKYRVAKDKWVNTGEDEYSIDITFNKDAKYDIAVNYTDATGNVATEASAHFVIDTIAPIVEVTYNNTDVKNTVDNVDYLNSPVTATIKITEYNWVWDPSAVKVTATDITGKKITSPAIGAWSNEGSVHTADIVFRADANYVFTLKYKDPSGNEANEISRTFVIDSTPAVIESVTYGNNVVTSLLHNITFGIFFKDTAEITVKASDKTSGIKSIRLSGTLESDASSVNAEFESKKAEYTAKDILLEPLKKLELLRGTETATFSIPANFRGKIAIDAVDYSENIIVATSEDLAKNTDLENKNVETQVIVDNIKPVIEVSYDNNKFVTRNSKKYYNAAITATVTVDEANFFAEDVILTISAKDSRNKSVELDRSLSKADKNLTDKYYITADKWSAVEGTDKHVAKIVFDKDGEYTFEVNYTDKSGNTADGAESAFVMDTTAAEIGIEYDNNDCKTVDGVDYYGADRKAVVTVEEANFDANDAIFTVTSQGDNGEPVKLDSVFMSSKDLGENEYRISAEKWTRIKGTDKYTAEILFDLDAEYDIVISYTDIAGNKANDVKSNFVIDKTKPVIKVTYDNNDVKGEENGAEYYDAPTTATIEITEHNWTWNPDELKITATDITGKETVIPTLNGWNDNGNIHTAKIVFNEDSNYIFEIANTDKAGNKDEYKKSFVIDKTASVIESITYDNNVMTTLINNLTFGIFFKDTAEITVVVSDMTSGVKGIVLDTDLDEDSSSVNKNIEPQSKEFKAKEIFSSPLGTAESGRGTETAKFSIPANFNGRISIEVVDYSCNSAYSTNKDLTKNIEIENKDSETKVIVDNIAPIISMSFDNNDFEEHDGINYYKDLRTATVKVNEANFFADDVYFGITAEDNDGKLPALDSVLTAATDKGENVYRIASENWSHIDGTDEYIANIVFDKDAEYDVSVNYTDRSGNKADEVKAHFTVDRTAPVIKITYDNNDLKNTENGIEYYGASRTATIEITEHNWNTKSDDIKITATDVNGKAIEIPVLGKWNNNGNVHTATLRFTNDANYTFKIENTDFAGNLTQLDEQKFTVDATRPEIKSISFKKSDAKAYESFEKYSDFKYFCNSGADVTLTVSDATAGIKNIDIYTDDYTNDSNGVKKVYDTVVYSESKGEISYTFTLPTDFKGYVFAQATDFSLNKSSSDGKTDSFNSSVGAVLESNDKHLSTLDMKIEAQVVPNKNGFYNADLPVKLYVKDSYSGIKDIRYKIGSSDEAGEVFTHENDITYSWTKDVVINAKLNNSNEVVVYVSFTDNAGNPHEKREIFKIEYKIDVTAPVISVSYDNNSVDNGKYFKANRTALIKITELNFDANDVVINITKDGEKYVSIIPSVKSWNHSGINHTASIIFSSDGDYTFDISYTDLAGNKNAGVDFGKSVDPKEFTVDKTKPVIQSITFNNNSSVNGNYFSSSRVATVTVIEHNFMPSKTNIRLTATDDGKSVATPTPSSWKNVGRDMYSATVAFSADAMYSITAQCTDLAGNAANDYAKESFYIDNIDPQVVITGVTDKSANNGKIAPVISISDTNIDYNAITVMLTGARNGAVVADGSESRPHNGYVFTFNDFKAIAENDDVYTLTVSVMDRSGRTNKYITTYDASGNQTKLNNNSLEFSVNRFGSNYQIDSSTGNINGKYINKERDVVITETNANALKQHIVTLYKGNQKIELIQGVDYKIDVTGGNGKWYNYVYTIFKKNFVDESVYSIEIYSVDEAGNVSENTLDTKAQNVNFVVDKTAPVINVTNISNGQTVVASSYDIIVDIKEDMQLSNVSILLDGNNATYRQDDSRYIITVSGNTTLKDSKHNLKIVAADNVNPEVTANVDNFSITTSRFVAFVNNKPLFYGSIGGLVVIVAAIVILVVLRRKKTDREQEQF